MTLPRGEAAAPDGARLVDNFELEASLEADDGVVELERVLAACAGLRVYGLAPGPRRWGLTDVAVDLGDAGIEVVRLTFRTRDRRVVTVASRLDTVDRDPLVERLATPLLFASLREHLAGQPTTAIMAAIDAWPRWAPEVGGWRYGQSGHGSRPVRLAAPADETAPQVLATVGVAPEELATLALNAELIVPGGPFAALLATAHRRHLAQRWWDAPRRPWRPSASVAS